MNELIAVMQRQLSAYQMLRELSQEKREVIKKNDVDRLNEIITEERELLLQTDALEEERIRIAHAIGKKIHKDDPVLDDIIAAAAPPASERLRALKNELAQLLRELKQLNDINNKLLETQLQYLDFMLNVATSAVEVNNLYENSGDVGSGQKTTLGLIDTSI